MLTKKPSLRVNEINPFLANVLILYTLKSSENQRFSGVFRGYKMRALAKNSLKSLKLKNTMSFKKKLSAVPYEARDPFLVILHLLFDSFNHINFQKKFSVTLGIGKMKL